MSMSCRLRLIDNRDGWRLELRRYRDERYFQKQLRPLLLVPGYCMNTFILAYHPRGLSMVEYLTQEGFEVWTVNLRGQGDSEEGRRPGKVGFKELSQIDIPIAIEKVLAETHTSADRVDAIGCSLGGTLLYSYLSLNPQQHRLGSMVGLGAPLRWQEIHPLLKLTFGAVPSPVIRRLKVKGTRRIARRALPVARRVPGALNLYMNAAGIDLSRAGQLVRTVDDPDPNLNVQIAKWVKNGDLIVSGTNVSEGQCQVDLPILSIFANKDGIVPVAAARSIQQTSASQDLSFIEAGDANHWYAHADLFINDSAQAQVFEPMSRWLKQRQ